MNRSVAASNKALATQSLTLSFDAASQISSGLVRVLLVFFAASLAVKGAFTPGMLIAFLAYNDQFTTRSIGMINFWIQFRMLRLQADRLSDIVFSEPEKHLVPSSSSLQVERLELKSVSFRYSAFSPRVLDNCSLDINRGDRIVIVGPSGSGKSTVLKILAGLIDPDEGEFRVDGANIAMVGKFGLRNELGVVLQDDTLFAGTIAENISMFSASAEMEVVSRAATLACVHEEILRMPMQYQTMVGDMGSTMSGGQRQRVLLARALYRGPRVLLLDEATSHLDIPNERAVFANIEASGITTVLVAHRVETIALASRVIVLQDGGLSEFKRPQAATDLTSGVGA